MNAVLSSTPSPPSPPLDLARQQERAPPRRYLALWLPFLPAERSRRACAGLDETPLVLVEKQRGVLRIVALDAAAGTLGLVAGMSLADARGRVPELAVAGIDRDRDIALLTACLRACERFTPLAACDGADGLVLDISGCAHLFGGEAGLLVAVQRLIHRLGLSSRAAIADTPDAARAFARFSPESIIPAGAGGAPACALPVAALEADSEICVALTRAGLKTLGDLARRPAATLAARFGSRLVARLGRILGREDLRITPARAPPEMVAEKHFPAPLISLEALMEALSRLVREIGLLLDRRGVGGRVFAASFFRADGAVRTISIETGKATRDQDVLLRLIRLRIEALADPLDPGFGFDAVRLAVLRSERLAPRQDDLAGPSGAETGEAALAGLVGRLVARFGRENVLRFIARDSHDPGRAGGLVPALSAGEIIAMPGPEPGEPPARPLMLFARPQPVEALAEVPDGPPLRFRWRRVLHEVIGAEGPERIAPEWWREGIPEVQTRDYYRVENTQGQRFWLFREGLYGAGPEQPRWFIHGLFA